MKVFKDSLKNNNKSRRYLSNFYYAPFIWQKKLWPGVEKAYVYAKCTTGVDRHKILATQTPKDAKRLGYYVKIRPDWEDVKVVIMYQLIRAKFLQNKYLLLRLLSTNDEILIHENIYHDNFWGHCLCPCCIEKIHYNILGRIIMLVRSEFQGVLK